jgi:hypothetical protein
VRAHATPVWQRLPLDPFGLWRSLVARSVRVGEVAGSNPVSPISRPLRKGSQGPVYSALASTQPRTCSHGYGQRLLTHPMAVDEPSWDAYVPVGDEVALC